MGIINTIFASIFIVILLTQGHFNKYFFDNTKGKYILSVFPFCIYPLLIYLSTFIKLFKKY